MSKTNTKKIRSENAIVNVSDSQTDPISND